MQRDEYHDAMIDLDDLRAFQKVGTLLSFSDAARTLGVRKSAVSRAIRRLEDALHVRLFERTTRSVALTEVGRIMLSEIDDVSARLDRFVDIAAEFGNSPRGRLRISTEIGFGLEVLTELIPDFADAYPDISISLDLTSRVVDLVAEQVDVAFRMGPLKDSNLISTRLGAMKCSLLAAPSYLARRGTPQTVDDLAGHDVMAIPCPDGLPRQVTLYHADATERLVSAKSRVTANDLHAICQMVVRGAGIAAMADFATAQIVESGGLVVVLPAWRPLAVDMSIVMPSGKTRSPAVRAFVDFARERIAARADWFSS